MNFRAALRLVTLVVLVAVLGLATTACGPVPVTGTSQPATATPVTRDTQTPLATSTSTLVPTAEPTVTPLPTATATPLPLLARLGEAIAFVSNDKIHVVSPDGGSSQQLVSQKIQPDGLAWSPDGTRIAYSVWRGGGLEIFIANVVATDAEPFRLTHTPGDEMHPAWSPDGVRIAFCAERDGNLDVYVINTDGSGEQRLTSHESDDCAPDWSPDGRGIAFESSRDGNREIYIVPVPPVTGGSVDDTVVQRLTDNDVNDYAPAWSPDGTRIAFYSSRGKAYNIYVMNADGSDEHQLTSDNTSNEWWPSWSPDGSQIAYCKMQDGYLHEIYAMSVNAQGQSSNQQRLTTSTADDWFAAWRPVVGGPASTTESRAPRASTVTVSVPSGKPVNVDGTLSSDEWDDAIFELLSDGSELLMMHADGYLYLGIRSTTRESFATNIYVEDNDQVRILHSSAALGTAIYQQGTDSWQQTRVF
ncbi:MAG: DPP IV N-terminal domain-containing protein, partial [Anaerolineae bacterium]|nr:DPP IV N-terminal domain-containing protein [Anaerolineae bacterium]